MLERGVSGGASAWPSAAGVPALDLKIAQLEAHFDSLNGRTAVAAAMKNGFDTFKMVRSFSFPSCGFLPEVPGLKSALVWCRPVEHNCNLEPYLPAVQPVSASLPRLCSLCPTCGCWR